MPAERLAIRLMIAQAVLFAAETAAIHQIGSRASVMQLALVRAAGGVVLALVLAHGLGVAVVRTRQFPLQLLRGGVSLLYLWIMVYSFAQLPFADATAISYTQVAYITAFSVVILGESVAVSRWAAAAIAIIGGLLIARPAFSGISGAYLIALFGAGLNGLAFVLNRYLQRQDREVTTMFYTNAVMLVGNLPALALALPPSESFLWLPGILLCGPIGMYLGIVAVRRAHTSLLAPYTLLRLPLAVLAGMVAFSELPGILSVLGAVLIVASCLVSTRTLFASPRRLGPYLSLWAPRRGL
jgi:drug/metabolite transporter (DMT)-like permease